MDYILGNKEAWEESFAVNKIEYGKDNVKQLEQQSFPFLTEDLINEIKKYDFKGKKILQLCCNNGREIMSIVKNSHAHSGIGIDIAENIIAQATENAEKAKINCKFRCANVLDIQKDLLGQFDAVFILVGAICWFKDLNELFSVASQYLKEDGLLFVNEIHPCTNMLAVNGEDIFDPKNPTKISWSYFKDEPFQDDFGMAYVAGGQYKSKVFTSFSFKISDIVNGICKNKMNILNFKEFDYDIGGEFGNLNGQGFPLSFIITAKKTK